MKSFVTASLALLLQVNAGAEAADGILNSNSDACKFAKSADSSADSNLCAKEGVVDARGTQGRVRAGRVGQSDSRSEKGSSVKTSVPPISSMAADARKKSEGWKDKRSFLQEGELVTGGLLVVGALFAPVTLAGFLVIGGGALIADGYLRGNTGKGLADHIFDRFAR